MKRIFKYIFAVFFAVIFLHALFPAESSSQETLEREIWHEALDLKCLGSGGIHKDFINSEKEYEELIAQSPDLHPNPALYCVDYKFPKINFERFTLLGLSTDVVGCEAEVKKSVSRDDVKKEIRYTVYGIAYGTCEKANFSNNFILIEKIPEDYKVKFDVKEVLKKPRPQENQKSNFRDKVPKTSVSEQSAMVTVDLAAVREGQRSMVGFLISGKSPPANLIRPLKPQILRLSPAIAAVLERKDQPTALYHLVKESGAVYHFLLGYLWGNPGWDWWGNSPKVRRFPPYKNYQEFEEFVKEMAQKVKDSRLTEDEIIMEVWNEPDGNQYWPNVRYPTIDPASEGRFFETYRVAARAIREILPNHKIAGPSWSWYNKNDIKRFLDFCVEKCEVNVLTWHEINAWPFKGTAEIEQHLREMRREFLENPEYSSLKLKEIHINEFKAEPDLYLPGETLAYLQALELGGADRASQSCWGDNCEGGILTPESFEPRAVWWVYRAYAAGVPSRVKSHSAHQGIASLASLDGLKEGQPQILVGHVRVPLPKELQEKLKREGKNLDSFVDHWKIPETQPAIPVVIEVRGLKSVPQLSKAEHIIATVYRIPQNRGKPLDELQYVDEIQAPVIDGKVKIEIEEPLRYQEVFVVELSQVD